MKQNLVHEIDEKGDIDYLAFTGRFVDAEDVPTDLLIVGHVKQSHLQALISKFEEGVPYEINYTLMPRDEFLDRRQVGDRFLLTILNGDKVVMLDRLSQGV
jgi:hypothetical protein